MGVYEFKCLDCQKVFSISVDYKTLLNLKSYCPDCNSDRVNRIFIDIPVIFKGKGFYTTDKKEKKINP